MRACRVSLIFFAALGTAHAQVNPSPEPLPLAPAPADIERGKAHYQGGAAYYQEARYDDALREFNEAYRLSKKPPLLFNIALCHEKLGHTAEAIASLERYLGEDPQTPDRPVVEQRLSALRAAPVAPPPAVAPPASPPPPEPRRYLPWAFGVVGLLFLGTGIGVNAVAGGRLSDLRMRCAPDGSCNFPDAQSEIDGGKAMAISSDVLIAVGAVAVAASAVLFILEARRRSHPIAWSPAGVWF
jgi:tetratricopeptide (TPR) repeat protein